MTETSEIDKLFKDVPPTSFATPKPPTLKPIDEIYQDLISTLNLSSDESGYFKKGVSMEKFKKTQILRMLLEVIVDIVDNSQKIQVTDKNDDSLYLQNKKIVRDLAFSLFQLLSNYNYNDREIKILLIGKTIQSLHGSN